MDANYAHATWGASAALDLHQLWRDVAAGAEAEEFTAVAPGDCRFTALLLARVRRYPAARVHAVVYEPLPEGLARHLLLLSVLLDDNMPLRERVELFLELHGNARLRDRSAEYLAARGTLLADVVLAAAEGGRGKGKAPDSERARLGALFDLTQLKFKERDALVDVFRSYSLRVPFDVERLRDARMRAFYGERYDARQNVHDYEYHMRLAAAGGRIVHPTHFALWRDSGVAYPLRDASAPAPNRSLASTAAGTAVASRDRNGAEQGRQVLMRGFWCDIANGPYHSFGTWAEAADAPRLFALRNREHVFTAVDLAKHNVTAMIHELRTGEPFRMPPPEREEEVEEEQGAPSDAGEAGPSEAPQAEKSAGGAADAPAAVAATPAPPSSQPDDAAQYADGDGARAALGRCRVTLLTGDVERTLLSRASLAAAAHAVTVATAHTRLLAQGLERLASPRAVLAVEGADFVLALKQQQVTTFAEHVASLGAAADWRPLPRPAEQPLGAPLGHVLLTRAA